jgi:hypothetical protein
MGGGCVVLICCGLAAFLGDWHPAGKSKPAAVVAALKDVPLPERHNPALPPGPVAMPAPITASVIPPAAGSAPVTARELPPHLKRRRAVAMAAFDWPAPGAGVGDQQRLRVFDDLEVTVEWSLAEAHSRHNHAWHGTLVEDPGAAVTLTRVGGHTILDIQSPAFGHFEIGGPDDGIGRVCQFDCDRVYRGCATCQTLGAFGGKPGDAEAIPATHETPGTNAVTAVTIDVLMVYTAAARTKSGSRSAIVAKAQSAVNGENGNFNRSNVAHRMRLVQTREVGHTASGNLVTELGWVAGNSTVADVRATAGADVVAFLSDRDDNGIYGVAHQLTSTSGNSGQVFSANYYDTAAGVWPHEVGHNLGCQHNSAGVYSYSSGHYWTDGSATRGSIMSYIGTRIPYFSNPDVDYSGKATGTSSRDNARSIDEIGDNVAGYKSSKTLIEPSCSLSTSTATPYEGTDFSLTVATTNGGPSAATSCKITVTLPSRLTLVTHDGGAAYSPDTGIWTVPTLADGATAKLKLTVRANAGSAGVSLAPKAVLTAIGSSFVDFDLYNNEETASVVPRVIPLSDLLLHFPLDESSGKTAGDAAAEGGYQNASTGFASPQWQPTGGVIGGALRLAPASTTEVTQAFNHTGTAALVTAYPFTIGLWVRAAATPWFGACAVLGDPAENYKYFQVSLNGAGTANAMARNTTQISATSPASVADGQWHHLAAVYHSATLRTLYLDGVAVATNTTSVSFVSTCKRFSIGALLRPDATQAFVGELDDIGLWTSALTAKRIALIHGLGRFAGAGLADPAIDTLLALTDSGFATAGGSVWVPATGLAGPVGSCGTLADGRRYVVTAANGVGLLGLSRPEPVLAGPPGGPLVLSWHAGFADWQLQETTDLEPAAWSAAELEIRDDGQTRSVEIPLEDAATRFFRLARP